MRDAGSTLRCHDVFRLLLGIAFAMTASLAAPAAPGALVAIGSGSVGGVYYPAAGALCRLLNQGVNRHGIRCVVDSSGGSVQNVRDILDRQIDFGIVQTDIQAASYHGVGRFSDSPPAQELRALFTVHPEPFTVISRLDAGIRNFSDLRGKRVNLGKPNSGTRATMERVMAAFDLTEQSFAATSAMDARSAGAALCENKIDAFVYVVGHPNRSVRSTSEACAIRIVNVSGDALDEVLKAHEYFAATKIPGGLYVGNRKPTNTFGVRASVLGLDSIPESVAYELTRSVFERLDELRGLHPAFRALSRDEMLQGNAAPFHRGALRYFEEAGLKPTP